MPDNRELLNKHNPHSRIWPGKKTTYLDDQLKTKKDIPYKFYEVGLTLLDPKHKSNICKAKRKMMGDDI